MSLDLTDRGIKLLYRQRGSHLRKVHHDSDDDIVVIQAPHTRESEDVQDGFDQEVNDNLFNDEPDPMYLEEQEQPNEPAKEEAEIHEQAAMIDYDDEVISYYNFQDIPLRQLSSSITSITSIDVLISMFTNLFQNDLIPQAMRDFNNSSDRRSKMMYKLDVRIFQSVLDQLVKDFKDILDINMSNNELCYQLKQIVMAREELNEQLVQTRKELHHLKCGGELYQLQQDHSILNKRIELNEQLNQLNNVLSVDQPSDSPFVVADPLTRNEDINEFCELMNPYNGVLAKVENLNEKLQKEAMTQ